MSLRWVADPYVWRSAHGEDVQLVRPYVLAHERAAKGQGTNDSEVAPAGLTQYGTAVTL
ncbi:hypothetical protein [Streptomyces sp. x-80]|uniref:hypothetical protein n=1 Tax=Streptomyces sp. x-80 TaxID=2789282 RepID=UPI00397F5CEB